MKSSACIPIVALAAVFSSISAVRADISYAVSVKQLDSGSVLHVQMTVPSGTGREVLECPVWQPGAYDEGDYGKRVQNFSVANSDGSAADFQHPDFSTWVVEGNRGNLVINYDIPTQIDNNVIHYSGPTVYLYVKDRQEEGCHLNIKTPDGWKIAMGLDPEGSTPGSFSAPTYEVLADTPVTMGNFIEKMYMSHGRPHYIAIYGSAASKVDLPLLEKSCQYVSDAEGNFFGDIPYKRYVWHFSAFEGPDGGGGLEHLNGTEITLSSGVGPGMQGVLMHEFFHLWNVKRIRSVALGPFDYTQLPRTGALWWLEGITDYYAHTLEYRYGFAGKDRLYGYIASQVSGVESNPNRFKISPYDSSFRVRDASEGRGNSNGYLVSYYNTGWLLGMMLDIDIRTHTNDQKSLDSVELALWKLCKNSQPGFQEDEIRNLCAQIGGPEVAADFDKWVMQPGDLPIAASMSKVGLLLNDTVVQQADLPFASNFQMGKNPGLVVTDPKGTDLKVGDRIVSENGIELADFRASFRKLRDMQSAAKQGDALTLVVERDGQNVTVNTTFASKDVHKYTVTDDPNATDAQKHLRESWLAPRPGTHRVYDKPVFP